ncbi:MAG: hypothetical protein IJD16_10555 [Desulfovibrio sp.]|nr:hypothetical protein [Desulfovibrio sp.]
MKISYHLGGKSLWIFFALAVQVGFTICREKKYGEVFLNLLHGRETTVRLFKERPSLVNETKAGYSNEKGSHMNWSGKRYFYFLSNNTSDMDRAYV